MVFNQVNSFIMLMSSNIIIIELYYFIIKTLVSDDNFSVINTTYNL